jgi:alanine racemase
MRSKHITVTINLDQIAQTAEALRRRVGVPVIAVIKADAYGLGAPQVADALDAVVDDFAFFAIEEARVVARPGIVLGPPDGDPDEYRDLGLRPTIGNRDDARRYRGMRVAVSVDTGMQRFGCLADDLDDVLRLSGANEAFSHGSDPSIGRKLVDLIGGRVGFLHVACTAMLDAPEAWLNAVRPGLALYRGAVRVAARLTHVRDTYGPAGYTGFAWPRIGLFPAGYAEGVQPGPVIVNGRRQRLIEVNMNASYVTLDAQDQVGDEVVILGDGLTEAELAKCWNVRDHEVLCRTCRLGLRHYIGRDRRRTRRKSGIAKGEEHA